MQRSRFLFLALTTFLITILSLFVTSHAVTPKGATWQDVVAEAERGGYRLIKVEELWNRLQEEPENILLVDTRQDWEYRSGHIAGSTVFSMEPTWWSRWRKQKALEKFLGPDKTKTIVFYCTGLTCARSDSAARVAVKLGYKNIYRYPTGFPEWQEMGLPTASLPQPTAAQSAADTAAGAPGPLHGWAMLWTLLGVFASGMALNLTPCVYPMIPITISYFGGRSSQSHSRLIGHGLCYLGGLATTNSILGVTAALTGGLLGGLLQNPLVLMGVAAVLVFFAFSMFGFWDLQLPAGLLRFANKPHAGYFGSLFMGLTLGVVAAPCTGPFVLGLLTWVAGMGSPRLGFIVFFTLSLGLGLPLFFLAIFSGKIEKLPRSGEWMVWVKKIMGWLLVGMAVYFLRPILPGQYGLMLLAAVALAAGVHIGWIDRTESTFSTFMHLKRTAGMAGILLSAFLVGSLFGGVKGVNWQSYSDTLLVEAEKSNQPVIMDFYAAWCTPCRELDEITFHDAQVVKLSEGFVMVKIDLTRGGNPDNEHLVQQYGVTGVPTIVFLDAQGKERMDLRLVGFMEPESFASYMKKALAVSAD